MNSNSEIPQKNIDLSSNRIDSSKILTEKVKEYTYQALKVQDEDKQIWALITAFPDTTIALKIIILILNLIIPG